MSRPRPQPTRDRWQPLRAGLVDLFYYDQEEFWFHDGRLLLRGNNGTGKSKVLALMLPFLLDGELSPHRVEPDADPKKRMEWNLLLGGEHPNPERLGYTWLELGRRDHDGTAHYCSLGCGLKAVSGRGIASNWFFVTRQRIGVQLALADGAGIALTRDRLEEAIGAEGTVHRTATAYRRAVDETLFGLGERRYGALVDLLIRIRAPQLSKKPNERALSDALTEALAPVDQALIADVAEAFRSLEEDRAALAAMIEARDGATAYLRTYRTYAQIASRRRATRLRKANSDYERVGRERLEAQVAHEHAAAQLQVVLADLAGLREDEARLRAHEQALRESPEARNARELDAAQREARSATDDAEQSTVLRGRLADRAERLRQETLAAFDRRDAAIEGMRMARATAAEAAVAALLHDDYDARVDAPIGATPVADLRKAAATLLERQTRAAAHVRGLLDVCDARRADVAQARERLDELAAEHDALGERRATTAADVEAIAAALVHDARGYLDVSATMAVADPAAALAALELWVETLDGPNPLRLAVDVAGRAAAARLAHADAQARARHAEIQGRAAEIESEIDRLESGEHDTPPAPHTRDPQIRARRSGAPFWQLVDFRDGLAATQRAGIEAALEAAGILDAWLTADGALVDRDGDDVLIAPIGDGTGAAEHLGAALVPAIDLADPGAATVSEATLDRVLKAIGLGEQAGPVWVDASGAFRNGVLRGRWQKPAATYVGHGAREAAARYRLAELRELLAGLRDRADAITMERELMLTRRANLETELAAMPGDEPLRDRHAALVTLDDERRRSDERLLGARQRVAVTASAAAAAEDAASDGADELRLPGTRDALEMVVNAVASLRDALAELWPALIERDRALGAAEQSAEHHRRAEAEAAEQAGRSELARRHAAELSERHRVLADTVGAAVAELQARLGEVGELLRANTLGSRQADEQRDSAHQEVGKQSGRLEQLANELEATTQRRQHEVLGLSGFAGTGLVAVALPDLALPDAQEDWTVTAAVRVARQIEQELSTVVDDEQALARAQRRATDELGVLADALRRHGNNASQRLQEEGIVVEVVFRGRSTTVAALASALTIEVDDRERVLSEREREILENHLVNEVASSLEELISAAEQQVLDMNAELAERPTSTGMRLRLNWQTVADGPQGLTEARERLLRQQADAWSDEDRASVGGFLQAQIQDVRARDGAGTWLEHLTMALDYRTWHRFTIERHQGGTWRSATGPASGGERVLAASVPLFAAASSHYKSASNPHAPRLVMLDEAFAGVDDDSRAKCLGLLTAFDLDVVMTSEREWGCYPEVPGLAIAQLSRVDGVAAVLVTHWEWDGLARSAVDRPITVSDAQVSAVAASHAAQEDLWTDATTNG